MALPKYNELYTLFLAAVQDGKVHGMAEIRAEIAQKLHLTQDELEQKLSSGKQTVFSNRVGWAKTYLKKAGLLHSPKRGSFQISEEGYRLLTSGEDITNDLLCGRYSDFAEFWASRQVANPSKKAGPENTAGRADGKSVGQPEAAETPQETLDRVYGVINKQLAEDLLEAVMEQSPSFFENLVVDLMKCMNYGDGFVTKTSHDEGIDGIIHEDKLGFNLIYIQAKRWNPNTVIGKPEIQKFAGAMMGPPRIEKGLFISTASFSQGARMFAEAQHIILVDGQKLTELMIECGLGVFTQKAYFIKQIDNDFFDE